MWLLGWYGCIEGLVIVVLVFYVMGVVGVVDGVVYYFQEWFLGVQYFVEMIEMEVVQEGWYVFFVDMIGKEFVGGWVYFKIDQGVIVVKIDVFWFESYLFKFFCWGWKKYGCWFLINNFYCVGIGVVFIFKSWFFGILCYVGCFFCGQLVRVGVV